MPVATYPINWDLTFSAVLQKKIGKLTRELAQKVVELPDQLRIMAVAEKFLQIYRNELRASSTLNNLQRSSMRGPRSAYMGAASKEAATSQPLWGMIGIPGSRLSSVTNVVDTIKLGQYASLTFIITTQSARGILSINFNDLCFDIDAQYHDGTSFISWVKLIEYGFDVPGYIYLRKKSLKSRSGQGVMGTSRQNFTFAGTHVFEDTFYVALSQLTPEELLILEPKFVE